MRTASLPAAARARPRVTVRPLRRADSGALTDFVNALVEEKKANRDLGIGGFDAPVTRAREAKLLLAQLREMELGEGANLVAVLDGRIVGHCYVKRRSLSDMRHTGVLAVIVLDGFRGKGIGRRLLEGMLALSLKMGVWLVELEVMAGNAAATALYEKTGFVRSGVVPGKVLRDGKLVDSLAMYADLRGTDKSPAPSRGRS